MQGSRVRRRDPTQLTYALRVNVSLGVQDEPMVCCQSESGVNTAVCARLQFAHGLKFCTVEEQRHFFEAEKYFCHLV